MAPVAPLRFNTSLADGSPPSTRRTDSVRQRRADRLKVSSPSSPRNSSRSMPPVFRVSVTNPLVGLRIWIRSAIG